MTYPGVPQFLVSPLGSTIRQAMPQSAICKASVIAPDLRSHAVTPEPTYLNVAVVHGVHE
jgi:hypothetical protein